MRAKLNLKEADIQDWDARFKKMGSSISTMRMVSITINFNQ